MTSPSLQIQVGSIVEIDRSHLPVAAKLPTNLRRLGAKVLTIETDEYEGWLYCTAHSAKTDTKILFGVPPMGSTYEDKRGPKLRIIR